MPRIREVMAEVQSHVQRTVYEVHPELSFFQLNGDQPLRHSKSSPAGVHERLELLEPRLRGLTTDRTGLRGANSRHILDGAAALWTARRISSRALTRVPETQEWDDEGLRMEIVR
jgi:predicted RNase H-like nuclease